MYDELAIVVGKHMAMGSFAKSYIGIDAEQNNVESTEMVANNEEEGVVDKGKNAMESSTTRSTISKSHKRGCAPPSDDSVLNDLSDQLKEIAIALKEINQGPVDYTGLYSEVMAMVVDRYSEDMLATVFNHLYENKKAAWGFLAKNAIESSTIRLAISKSRKRGRAPPSNDSVLTDLSNQLKEIVVALKEINQGPVDYIALYSEVMAMVVDGYSEDMLATIFDYLCENKKATRGFLAKNAKLRKLWMNSYFFT